MIGDFDASGRATSCPRPTALMVVKEPYQLREDGLTERVDCK